MCIDIEHCCLTLLPALLSAFLRRLIMIEAESSVIADPFPTLHPVEMHMGRDPSRPF
ncbi:MAG: hypothetical protein ABI690_21795 [Chloroflexota bacterium]